MRQSLVLGMVLATGVLPAREVRAQETTQATESKSADQRATSQRHAYGTYVGGLATPDANGVPVAKPNPMSRLEKRSEDFNQVLIGQPMLGDLRADDSTSDVQTK
jgi:hypothetical protein